MIISVAPLQPRRPTPRRSKSLGFRTSDEILEAYDAIQNEEIAQAEEREQKNVHRRRATMSHAECDTSQDDRRVGNGNAQKADSVATRRRPASLTKSGNVLNEDLLKAYEDIVSEFETKES